MTRQEKKVRKKSRMIGGTDNFQHLRKGNQKANLQALESAVNTLVKMATQKNAGQRKDGAIPWEILDLVKWQIICEATALVLDENFEKVKEIYKEFDDEKN